MLVVGDELIPRAALRAMLAAHRELRILGECDTSAARLESLRLNPQVVVIHAGVPSAAIQELIQILHQGPGVVLLTRESEGAYVRTSLASGVHAYVLVSAAPSDFLIAIRAAAVKKRFLDPSLGDVLVHTLLSGQPQPSKILSPRELQVLRLLAYGHTNQQIAEKLSVSRKSVDTYRQRLSSKLSLRSRADIVRYAISMGLMRVVDSDLASAS